MTKEFIETYRNLQKLLKRLFYVEYRLTVVAGGKYEHIHGRDKKLVMARLADIPNASHWTLYKRGAFGVKEREIERGGGR